MKIFVIVRTRNEHRNIERFCRSYSFADNILVADGGSDDDTIFLAQQFPNVVVREYLEKVYGKNEIWRNPEGRHVNFLIDWATSEGADWIVYDDCDSFPTKDLRLFGRDVFNSADADGRLGVAAHHIYLYGENQWFTSSLAPTGRFIWAWKPGNLRMDDNTEWGIIRTSFPEFCLELSPPHCLLHDFCPTPEITQQKLDFYNNCGKMDKIPSIVEFFGELNARETWMYE